jgi:hypothetical protein
LRGKRQEPLLQAAADGNLPEAMRLLEEEGMDVNITGWVSAVVCL